MRSQLQGMKPAWPTAAVKAVHDKAVCPFSKCCCTCGQQCTGTWACALSREAVMAWRNPTQVNLIRSECTLVLVSTIMQPMSGAFVGYSP